ncbi:TetR/AcrR family transcriptional regulator [Sporolactobacillus shoreicorticis]|uniref:TetR/AcrR family transcriptional regulator n=1 Tax=Sporolactobacillus shoreicorticis TaxID=1923877 RepID=A0ABW5S7D8_9BACL|nr:TetR/AcrR family transcriptional regulator [Sporolactobacillus shoreicorticis]MCO7125496.1 TetR/AcrR family transcriptional regulator [Sporolactobacillus shoreicorticis]
MASDATDLRVLKTRAAIQSHFLGLLLQKNFNEITVKDIASAAKIGRGTFYLHYEDKYNLLETVVKEGLAETVGKFRPHEYFTDDKVVPTRIVGFALTIFQHFKKNDRFFRAMLFNEGIPMFRHRMQSLFLAKFRKEIQQVHLPPQKADPLMLEILPIFISSAMIGLVSWWFENQMRISDREMAERIFLIVTRGPLKALGLGFQDEPNKKSPHGM